MYKLFIQPILKHLMKPLLYRLWVGSAIFLTSVGTFSFEIVHRANQGAIAHPSDSMTRPITIGAQTWHHPTLWRSLPFQPDNLAGDYRVALSPDGRLLAGGDRTTLTFWDVETGEILRTVPSFADREMDSWVGAIAFSPNGQWIAASSYEVSSGSLRLRVWNTSTGDVVNTIERTLSPHHEAITPDQPASYPGWSTLAFSPDSQRIATIAGGNEQLDIWEVVSGQSILTLDGGHGAAIAFSHDGQHLARIDGDRVLLWDLANPTMPQSFPLAGDGVNLVFSPDNRELYVAHRNASDLSLELRRWTIPTAASSDRLFAFHWSTQLTFSPDGTTLVAGSPHSPMTIHDLQAGQQLSTREEYFTGSPTTAFSQDSQTFAVTTGSQEIQIWHTGSPSLVDEPDMDNIYHEDENLPDDADIFPRMGHIEGETWERNNCRVAPWGQLRQTIPGDAFIEISDRTVDGNGESWFYATDMNCWLHDSRIDLL